MALLGEVTPACKRLGMVENRSLPWLDRCPGVVGLFINGSSLRAFHDRTFRLSSPLSYE